jgi:hypothetical protein
MDHITYNIPTFMLPSYRGKSVVIRSNSPSDLVESLSGDKLDSIAYIRLLSSTSDVDGLLNNGYSIPLDLVMSDPKEEFSLLYRYSRLLAKQPVRVSIPVTAGFSNAVRLAGSLNFAVKLIVEQPNRLLIEEMLEVLRYYLHHSTVSQPIEFFHSMLMTFYHDHPGTLWEIQEQHPAFFRYVSSQGEETVSERFGAMRLAMTPDAFAEKFQHDLSNEHMDCLACEFAENCCGYFKWPQKEYGCAGIKIILGKLKDAAEELKKNLSSHVDAGGTEKS